MGIELNPTWAQSYWPFSLVSLIVPSVLSETTTDRDMDGTFVTIIVLGLFLVVAPIIAFCIKARQRRGQQGQVFSSE